VDDPSFPVTIDARLIEGEDGTHNLIWFAQQGRGASASISLSRGAIKSAAMQILVPFDIHGAVPPAADHRAAKPGPGAAAPP
jgi:hypothetical protein